VTGDGIANTVRFESSTSTNLFTLSDQGLITAFAPATTVLTGTTEIIKSTSSFIAPSAGSGSFRPLSIAYTINNTGAQTGAATGIYLDATETALGGMTHDLMNLQVGGSSVFRASGTGACFTGASKTFTTNTAFSYLSNSVTITNSTSNNVGLNGIFSSILFSGASDATSVGAIRGTLQVSNTSASNILHAGLFAGRSASGGAFNFLIGVGAGIDLQSAAVGTNAVGVNITLSRQLGGTTTNMFGLRIADIVNATGTITNTYGIYTGDLTSGTQTNQAYSMYLSDVNARTYIAGQTSIGVTTAVASAIVQIDSTTQGFLPPRMTTTQKNAIATPATGLVVYDTTLNKLAVYTGAAWEAVTSA
jgi:hypothetical protein